MKVKELLDKPMNLSYKLLWVVMYDFKGGGSDFIYRHVKPTQAIVTSHCNDRYQSGLNIRYVNKKTGEFTGKRDRLYKQDEVFETEEDCINFYKERLEAHIDNKVSHIERQNHQIGKLREKIDSL